MGKRREGWQEGWQEGWKKKKKKKKTIHRKSEKNE
jgi:hypothetical protein